MANKLEIARTVLKVFAGLGFAFMVFMAVANIAGGTSGRLLQAEENTESHQSNIMELSNAFILFRLVNLIFIAAMSLTLLRCFFQEILSSRNSRRTYSVPLQQCACQCQLRSSPYTIQAGNPLPEI